MNWTAPLCAWAAVAGGGGSVRVEQVRVGAVVAAGTLASELALQALDETVLLLQLFRQPGRTKEFIMSIITGMGQSTRSPKKVGFI